MWPPAIIAARKCSRTGLAGFSREQTRTKTRAISSASLARSSFPGRFSPSANCRSGKCAASRTKRICLQPKKKDSQGICFVGKVDLPTFLKQKLTSVEGDIVEVFDAWYADDPLYRFQQDTLRGLLKDGASLEQTVRYAPEEKILTSDGAPLGECPYREDALASLDTSILEHLCAPLSYDIRFETEVYRSGKKHIKKIRYKSNPYGVIAGRHEGAQFYTVGQRKGLGVGGHAEPVFVIATDTAKNIVYVGEGHHHKGLSRFCLAIAPDEIHWFRDSLRMAPGEQRRYRVRIRYRQPLQSATLLMRENALYILFDSPQRGITPGQFAVWYSGDEMLGSGVIL